MSRGADSAPEVRERWHAGPEYRAAYEDASPAMDLAFAMAEARQAAKPSRAEAARRIGTSPAMAARRERGKAAPTTALPLSLRRFAEATGPASGSHSPSSGTEGAKRRPSAAYRSAVSPLASRATNPFVTGTICLNTASAIRSSSLSDWRRVSTSRWCPAASASAISEV